MMQSAQSWYSVTTWRHGVGRELGAVFRREGRHLYLWPIHANVWQKKNFTMLYSNYLPIKIKKKTLKRDMFIH